MPNSQYATGANFERRMCELLWARGWRPLRSAGSHSPADVVALKDGQPPLAVQCKAGRAQVDWQHWAELWQFSLDAGAMPVIAQRVLRHEPMLWLVTGPRPRYADVAKWTRPLDWDDLGMVVRHVVPEAHGVSMT